MTGKPRIAPKFSSHLFFKGSLIHNIELRDILARIRCMKIPIKPKELRQNWKLKIRMFRDYLVNCLYLWKINLKRPLSRGSCFKIYFRLECWGNRGSRQNFHEIPFSKDRILIKPDHFVTYHSMITCLSNKNKQFTSKHGCKRYRHGHWLIHTKIQNETINRACNGFPLFAIFYEFNKQNMLTNNN